MGDTIDIGAGIAEALRVARPVVDPAVQFDAMKTRLRARYGLAGVSGRPEELIRPSTSRGVSLGYGIRTIRVRLMDGRTWTDWHDFQLDDTWQDKLDAMCDEWFGKPDPLVRTHVPK